MVLDNLLSDKAVLKLLAERLVAYRLQRNWTQARLAEESGVSKRTIERLEAGESVQLANWLRVLRVLDRLPALEKLLPPPLPGAIDQLQPQGKTRQRASSSRAPKAEAPPGEWQWSGTDPNTEPDTETDTKGTE